MRIGSLIYVMAFVLFASPWTKAQQVEIHNPTGKAIWAVGSMKADEVGLKEGQYYTAVDSARGDQYAVQIDQGMISIGGDLAPFEARTLDIHSAKVATRDQVVSVVRQSDGNIKIENDYFSFLLDASKGYVFSELTDKEDNRGVKAVFGNLRLKRKTVRVDNGFPEPAVASQSEVKVICTLEQLGPVMVRVALSWSCEEGQVRETITAYAGSRVIDYSVHVKTAVPLDQVSVRLEATGYGSDAIIMPDKCRVSGTPGTPQYRVAPCQVVGFDPEGGKTLGLLTSADTKGTVGVYLCHGPEGAGISAFGAAYYSRYLANEPVGANVEFTLGLLIGGGRDVLQNLKRRPGDTLVLRKADNAVVRSLGTSVPWGITGQEMSIKPALDLTSVQNAGQLDVSLAIDDKRISSRTIQVVANQPSTVEFKWRPETEGMKKATLKVGSKIFNYNLEVKKATEIVKWWPDKLILPLHGEGTGTVVIKNNMHDSQQCSLRLTRISGIDEHEQVWQRDVTLLAGEQKEMAVRWQGGSREYGRELRMSLMQNGQVVDEQSEYTTLGDDFPRLVQLTVANPGWFCHNGQQNWMMPYLREGYTGTMEYYDWAPDSQYDIAPGEETWEPHTDSQVSYRSRLNRMFLKNTIELAHEHGLKVVAELNGMASLPGAMAHPEEMMYTEDGQPWIYNRKVYEEDGAEFATIFRDYYTKDRVLAWADEMIASVKMFDWDGVRFDCGFRPIIDSGDPYYQSHKIGDLQTYTFDGTPRRKIHKDPDATAAEFTDMWRKRLREYKPGFRYHTNACYSVDIQKAFPKWTKATAANGGYLLQEHMLYEILHDSIDEWAGKLKSEGENLRRWGGEPAVGWMSFGPPGYSSLMHWISFASGYHMYAWAGGRNDPIDPTWKEYRFALRYAEYLYAPDMQWLPFGQTDVMVSPDKGIMWRNFVYRRDLEGDRIQYIVDLVNLPDNSDKMYVNHAPATTKTDLQVNLDLSSASRLVKAWIVLAEPVPHARELDVSHAYGKAIVQIDRLEQFAMIIFELAP